MEAPYYLFNTLYIANIQLNQYTIVVLGDTLIRQVFCLLTNAILSFLVQSNII